MKVAISGSRAFTNQRFVSHVVSEIHAAGDRILVGDAPSGVDQFVREYVKALGLQVGRDWALCEADWETHGRPAGHLRNGVMIANADRLVAIFAPGERSPGTSNAITHARNKGIPVHIFHEGKWT